MTKIQASLVLEILGRPKEHVTETLQDLVTKMGTEKGVKVTHKNLHEPVPVENSDLLTSFAEIDVELDAIENLFFLIFAYMPAHIELVSPEKVTFTNAQLNELCHGLTQRLHQYESLSKNLIAERNFMAQKLNEVAPHYFKQTPATEDVGKNSKSAKKKKSG